MAYIYPASTLYPSSSTYTEAATTAVYNARIAWEPVPSNAFFLNGSSLDGTDQLTNQYSNSLNLLAFDFSRFSDPGPLGTDTPGTDVFAGSFDALYSDVSGYLKSIQTRRGRDDNLSDFTAGECTLVLNDPNKIFSPLNTSSPLYPNVLPGRPVVVEAIYDGARQDMFYGFVRSIEHDPAYGARETKVMCQDFMLYLSRAKPIIAATGPTTTGAAIYKVLDALDWTNPDYISLETGDYVPDFSADGTKTALNLIEELLEVERGEFFISRSGVVTYRQRASRTNRASSQTLTDVAAEATSATDLTNIKNRVIVSNTAGTIKVTSQDLPSATNYGFSDASNISSDYILTEAQAQSLGEWIISQTKAPVPPLRDLEFTANISTALFNTALALELGDKITVVDSSLGANSDFYVEKIAVQVGAGLVHKVSLSLTRASAATPLKFGTSRVRLTGQYFASPTLDSYPYENSNTNNDVFSY